MRKLFLATAAFMIAGTLAMAADSDIQSQLDDIKVKLEQLRAEKEAAACAEEAPDSLNSLRKTSKVKIGGDFEVAAYYTRNKVINTPFPNSSKTKVQSSEFQTNAADLYIDAEATENLALHVKLSLDDFWGGDYATNDDGWRTMDALLANAYMTYKFPCTGFEVSFGKMDLPFGLGKDDLLLSPYATGFAANNTYIFNGGGYLAGQTAGGRMYHANSEILERVFALMLTYNWNDKIRFDVGLFQDADGRGINDFNRSDDNGVSSYFGKITVTPIEGLEFEVSAYNRHHSSYADASGTTAPGFGPFGAASISDRCNEQALSVGFDWKLANLPLDFYAEYLHGWNQGFRRNNDSDNVRIGITWDINSKWSLTGQGEWLRITNDAMPIFGTVSVDNTNEFYRSLLAVQYKLAEDVIIEGGWQHEWYTGKWNYSATGFPGVNAKNKTHADTFYIGTKYYF